ncbi:MAG: hypothetical protein RLZZ324_189 [Candidatus Parcubacteria bacterium]|jgi:hypothetical protein
MTLHHQRTADPATALSPIDIVSRFRKEGYVAVIKEDPEIGSYCQVTRQADAEFPILRHVPSRSLRKVADIVVSALAKVLKAYVVVIQLEPDGPVWMASEFHATSKQERAQLRQAVERAFKKGMFFLE